MFGDAFQMVSILKESSAIEIAFRKSMWHRIGHQSLVTLKYFKIICQNRPHKAGQ